MIECDSDDVAIRLAQRSIFIKDIYQLWAYGKDYQSLVDQVRQLTTDIDFHTSESWRFVVEVFNGSMSMERKTEIVEMFSFMRLTGPISLSSAKILFRVVEDHSDRLPLRDDWKPEECMKYMGRWLASGNRALINKYNLKKREYLGTTSMDAELSLVMANQALLKPGKLVLDPFVGTGSFLCTSAEFGAYTMGADIDGRQIRGLTKLTKGRTRGVRSNIEQYNLQHRVLDCVICDTCHAPWRDGLTIFDAIITDPPYGVRAGAKKTSNHRPETHKSTEFPSMLPYDMSDVVRDLIDFSAKFLCVGGRLVFWLPTVTEEYTCDDIPTHPCMRMVANSEQDFGKWQRRLITMEKVENVSNDQTVSSVHNPAHADFRTKFFEAFESKGK